MRQLETVVLDRFNDTPVDKPVTFEVVTPDDRLLGYEEVVGTVPALTSEYNPLSSPQLVIHSEDGLALWDEQNTYPVGRRDTLHGRNLEVMAGRVLISDVFGNIFKSLSIKGSNFINPHFFESGTASRDFLVFGLQESLVIERVLRASQMMRCAGIHTEYICGVVLPTGLPVPAVDNIGIDSHTVKSLPELLEHVSSRYARENPDPEKSALEIKSQMVERFGDCEYMVTFRGLDCPYRARDIADPDTFEEMKQFVIDNYENMGKKLSETDYEPEQFLAEIWATEVGHNVAKMHNMGLVHGYLTSGNLTALGSIIDLDSVKGEPLEIGDEAINDDQKIEDIISVVGAIISIANEVKLNFDDQRIVIAETFRNFFYQYFKTLKVEDEDLRLYVAVILGSAAEDLPQDRVLSYLLYGVIAAYTHLCNNYDHLEKPLQLPIDENLAEEDLGQIPRVFSFVPPIFYLRERDKIAEAISHVKDDVLGGKYTISLARMPELINLATRRRFLKNSARDIEDLDLDSESFLASASFLTFVPESEKQRANAVTTFTHLEEMSQNTLAFLSTVDQGKMPDKFAAYLKDHDIEDYSKVGYLEFASVDDPIPVFFVDGQEDLKVLLDKLKITDDSIELDAIIPADLGDMIAIADYSLLTESPLLHMADHSHMQTVILSDLLKRFMPSIIISEISTGEPKVTVATQPTIGHEVGSNVDPNEQIPIFNDDTRGNDEVEAQERFSKYFWRYESAKE
jgi:hypothetical protein